MPSRLAYRGFRLRPRSSGHNMKSSPMKCAFHEEEVADVTFRAMVETGRIVLHMESSSGRVQCGLDWAGICLALSLLC